MAGTLHWLGSVSAWSAHSAQEVAWFDHTSPRAAVLTLSLGVDAVSERCEQRIEFTVTK